MQPAVEARSETAGRRISRSRSGNATRSTR